MEKMIEERGFQRNHPDDTLTTNYEPLELRKMTFHCVKDPICGAHYSTVRKREREDPMSTEQETPQ